MRNGLAGCGGLRSLTSKTALERAREIAEAQTIDEVWSRFVAVAAEYGFERVNYGYTRYRVGKSIGDPDDAMFLSTHSLEQVKWFHESRTYLKSADYRWVRDNVGACSWGWVHEERKAGRLSKEECEVLDLLRGDQAVWRAGFSISFPQGAPRSKGAMGLAVAQGISQYEVDAHWATHETAIMVLANTAHMKLSQLPLPVPSVSLSARQREILAWIADGKTLQDVCILTDLSLSAVDKHLRRMRDALGVETTAQAVAKVSFLNQIFVHAMPERGSG